MLPPWNQLLAVLIGGAIGSVLRFLAGVFFGAWLGVEFPWATLFVNVVGSLFLGWVVTTSVAKPLVIDSTTRLFLTTGFCGGLTTFSTFAFETLALFQRGDTTLGWMNVLVTLVLGIGGALLGIVIAKSQGAI
jgi:fluoride exporter